MQKVYYHEYSTKSDPLTPEYGCGRFREDGEFEWDYECDDYEDYVDEFVEAYYLFPDGSYKNGGTPYGPCTYDKAHDKFVNADDSEILNEQDYDSTHLKELIEETIEENVDPITASLLKRVRELEKRVQILENR